MMIPKRRLLTLIFAYLCFKILKDHNNFHYLREFESHVPNSFGEILFEIPQNLHKAYWLPWAPLPHPFLNFKCIFCMYGKLIIKQYKFPYG